MPIDTHKAQEQWSRYAYCRDNGHLDFVTKADKCDAFFKGDKDDYSGAHLKSGRR